MKIQGNGVQKKNKILVKCFLRILNFNSASLVIFGVTLISRPQMIGSNSLSQINHLSIYMKWAKPNQCVSDWLPMPGMTCLLFSGSVLWSAIQCQVRIAFFSGIQNSSEPRWEGFIRKLLTHWNGNKFLLIKQLWPAGKFHKSRWKFKGNQYLWIRKSPIVGALA